MKKIGIFLSAALFMIACNNSGTETNTTDSTAVKDNTNTNITDTGAGSSATDTMRRDTMNKMKDSTKNKKY